MYICYWIYKILSVMMARNGIKMVWFASSMLVAVDKIYTETQMRVNSCMIMRYRNLTTTIWWSVGAVVDGTKKIRMLGVHLYVEPLIRCINLRLWKTQSQRI